MAGTTALLFALLMTASGMAAASVPKRTSAGRRHCRGQCARAASNSLMSQTMKQKMADRAACQASHECPEVRAAQPLTPCVDGKAGEYSCKDVDMLSFVPLAALGINSSGANDIWGWTDPSTGGEYALVGLFDGMSFVDITDPTHPRVVGVLKTQTVASVWRDVKVFGNHAFVVSEAKEHGMQVFDLTRLRGKIGQGIGGAQAGAIRNRQGLCLLELLGSNASLGPNASLDSSDVELGSCGAATAGHAEMEWAHNRTTGFVVSQVTGLCLEAGGPLKQGNVIRTRSCDPSRAGQRWAYQDGTGQLVGRGGGCLDAEELTGGGRLRLRGCEAARRSQQWSIGAKSLEVFWPDAVYTEVGSAHNLAINEQTATAYILGSKTCEGGLHIVDISKPEDPTFLGCFSEDGYAHDAQCEIYEGPDARHQGREVCFSYNEDTLTVVDVTNADEPRQISRVGYRNSRYVHQGWLDERQEYLFLNDELDELKSQPDQPEGPSNHTRTLIWDVRNLSAPRLVGNYYSQETSIDHNLYVDGRVVFEANYCAGLRVLEVMPDRPGEGPRLEEVGFFDVAPDCDRLRFRGAWSSYPFYKNGAVALTSMERGLFVLQPRLSATLEASRLEAREQRGKRRARGLSLMAGS